MKNKDNSLQLMIKGFIIGSSMSVPGVSGGTMAIILGIYDRMIQAISGFLKDIKKNVLFLLKIGVGGIVGICSLSLLIKWLLEKAPVPVSFFFIGAVVAGIPVIMRKIHKSRYISTIFFFMVGLAAVVGISFLPEGLMQVRMDLSVQTLIFWAITGVVVALALVLPGISTSHMLVVLGLYEATLSAISGFDIMFLVFLLVSVLAGVFLTTKPLEWLMNKYTTQTYSGILGFVVGSLSAIFKEIIIPGLPKKIEGTWILYTAAVSIVLFIGGIIFIRTMDKMSKEE